MCKESRCRTHSSKIFANYTRKASVNCLKGLLICQARRGLLLLSLLLQRGPSAILKGQPEAKTAVALSWRSEATADFVFESWRTFRTAEEEGLQQSPEPVTFSLARQRAYYHAGWGCVCITEEHQQQQQQQKRDDSTIVYEKNGVHYIDSGRTGRHYIYYDAGLQGQKKGLFAVFLCCSCDEALGRNGCWLLRLLFFQRLQKLVFVDGIRRSSFALVGFNFVTGLESIAKTWK